jgi:hypothetical protein
MTSSAEYDDTREKPPDSNAPARDAEAVDPALRNRTQRSLGRDASPARIHTGPAAQSEAEQLGARAFTRKKDIYFARDEYRPGTEEGKRLLAHELAHTIQQSGLGTEAGDQHALEAEAGHAAGAVMDGNRSRVGLRAPHGVAQLQEKGKAETPSVRKHPDELTPAPARGTISGAGMTVSYLYGSSTGAFFVTLTLQVSEGVAVVATPLTDLHEGVDYRVQNAGGTKARAVVVSVGNKPAALPKLQVTFSRGSAGYVVVFQFPSTTEKK